MNIITVPLIFTSKIGQLLLLTGCIPVMWSALWEHSNYPCSVLHKHVWYWLLPSFIGIEVTTIVNLLTAGHLFLILITYICLAIFLLCSLSYIFFLYAARKEVRTKISRKGGTTYEHL